ncbi:Putative transforming growth factor beta-1-induced transcript 1 protein [Gryllus bimaculatus]|nr:Putative transforming growth factor beta-1-induced transcript 1 protein [Gryllus bimaculatus]
MKCSKELGGSFFVERDGKAFCVDCFQKLFSPKCAGCKRVITDVAVIALDQTWHTFCFRCKMCRQIINNSEFGVYKGEAILFLNSLP